MNAIHVFDCDGVLVNSSHRYRNLPNGSIDLDYWIRHNVPAKVALDSLLPHSETYRKSLACSVTYTVIATARLCATHDFRYFRDKLGWPQHLISRKPNDTRSDWLLKLRGLNKLLSLKQFRGKPVTVWEDNRVTIRRLKRQRPDWSFNYVPSNQGPTN